MRGSRMLAIGMTACLLVGGAVGCGESNAGGATPSAPVSSATQSAIDAALKGSFAPPPTSAPRPQPGKNVWFIPLSSSIDDFAEPGSIHDAAKRMGWKL